MMNITLMTVMVILTLNSDGDFDPETRNKDKEKDNNNVSCVNTKCDVDPLFRAPCKEIDKDKNKDKDKDKEEDKDEGRVEFGWQTLMQSPPPTTSLRLSRMCSS